MLVTSWRGFAADLAVAMIATATMILASLESADSPARPVDAWAIAAIGVVGAWTAFARRAPRVALAGSCVSFYTALAVGVPAFSPALALGVPVLGAAWSGHLRWAVAVLGVIGATSGPYRLTGPGAEPLGQVALSTLFDMALVAVLLLLGDALRSRRVLREEAGLRLRLAQQEHRRTLTEARLRAARDLHDVLAHTVAVVGIHTSVAAETIDTRPSEAKQAMDRVRHATREATADLRSTISVLREETSEVNREPAPGVHEVPDLVAAVDQAGIDTSLSVRGEAASLRPAIGLTVYRIVQESLTNVLRHSGARSVRIEIDVTTDAVAVDVRDDGEGGTHMPGDQRNGSGLRGMAERVAAIGGRLQHGPTRNGEPGYLVHASLPTRCRQ